jgi:two-component system sensor histidine kinase ChiS
MEGTVISDAVNTAARLEGLTKRYGVNIIISGDTLSRLTNPNGYHHRILDRVKVKGRYQPISLYGIFDGDPPEQMDLRKQTQPEFEEGWSNYYAQSFSEAHQHFHSVLEQDPQDKAAQLYLERSTRFMEQEGPIEWDHLVESLTEK